ncbi:MAG: metalloregulator ArsR/SmtB family transcription factor [Acidimicrobiia bacterium]
MQAVLEVVAEPRRRQIMALLLERERLVGDLAAELHISQPAVSKHLRVMRDAGLVEARVDAQRRWYHLVGDPLAELDDWLQPYRQFWEQRLDALAQHLDSMEDS